MLRNAHNSLILPLPQIAQVIVGSLFFLFLIHLLTLPQTCGGAGYFIILIFKLYE